MNEAAHLSLFLFFCYDFYILRTHAIVLMAFFPFSFLVLGIFLSFKSEMQFDLIFLWFLVGSGSWMNLRIMCINQWLRSIRHLFMTTNNTCWIAQHFPRLFSDFFLHNNRQRLIVQIIIWIRCDFLWRVFVQTFNIKMKSYNHFTFNTWMEKK